MSIDSTARALDISTRSLQRALHRDGADFRSLANAVRARRASELLTGTGASITEIATELGYSTPANPARAFRKATGVAPQDFRDDGGPGFFSRRRPKGLIAWENGAPRTLILGRTTGRRGGRTPV